MTFIKFLKAVVTAGSGISSKRVCGLLGWLFCIFTVTWCTVKEIQAPDIADTLFYCSTTLLGVDCITRIWKKDGNTNELKR